ncbi:MAG: M24 family metallopeptidase, partial [Candidatus Anammoxibacter sp.]
ARGVIESEGFGDKFIHRTGHSIGEEIHANGANMDNLETHDDRRLLNSTCFSIEPGIYTGTYGVRTEIDVLITADGEVKCTGGKPQTEIVKI